MPWSRAATGARIGSSVRVALAAATLAIGATLAWAQPALREVRAVPAESTVPGFTADEVARILSHGPWPPLPASNAPDPTNRVSGNADAAAFGRSLFFDPRLSANGAVSCASCHDPGRGFTDGRARALGIALHDRNTQGLLDVARQRWFGWDGGADSLWSASIRPMLAAGEMAARPAALARTVREDAALARAYSALFGEPASDEDVLVGVAKSIAAFLETLVSPATRFDAFRDALRRGDATAAARYPATAKRGLKIFLGRGNCGVCHLGPRFTNDEFHDVGIRFFVEPGRVDPGRHAGIIRVRADPYNLLSRFNDQRAPASALEDAALKTRTVALHQRNFGEWKVPSLRNLRSTGPYMHDGSKASLREVVEHYSELNPDRLHADGESILKPLHLSRGEIEDLVAFLESLSR